MRERKRETVATINKRYADATEACFYFSLGRNSLMKLAKSAGAERRVGRRVLFDLHQIDKFLGEQQGE